MVLSRRRRRRAIAIVVAALALNSTGAQAQLLDAVICGMDPLYDYCLANRLTDFAEQGMPNGVARDQALIASFAGIYFSQRSEEEQSTYVPDPSYYRAAATSDLGDTIITLIDLALREENYEAAAAELDAIEPGPGRLIALRYLAEGHLRFGDEEMGLALIDRFAEEIGAIPNPQSQLGYLPDLAWLHAIAGAEDAALAVSEEIVAIAESHPIEQLRAIFAIPAALGEGVAYGTEAGAARIEAGLEALESMDGLPPALLAETYAIAAENYGRLGLVSEARQYGNSALNLILEVEVERRWRVLRDVMEAGIPF